MGVKLVDGLPQVMSKWQQQSSTVTVTKWSIAVCNQLHRYWNSHAIWDHTVLLATLQT